MLDKRQREVCYETLSRVLGPAAGIQECVGTYKAHMSKQTEVYYEDFLPDLTSDSASRGLAHAQDQSLAPSDSSAQPQDSELWSALSAILDIPASSGDWTVPSAVLNSDALALDDVLASPILREREPRQAKTVSFVADTTFLSGPSSGFLSPPILPFFDSNSSSLAGALGDPNSVRVPDSEARRKSKEWTRPRMGRARAYSAGGGM